MSKCFICGNDATGVTGDSNVCFSCYSKPKESTLISRIEELEAELKYQTNYVATLEDQMEDNLTAYRKLEEQLAEIATDRLEFLKRAEAAEAQVERSNENLLKEIERHRVTDAQLERVRGFVDAIDSEKDWVHVIKSDLQGMLEGE